MSEETYAIVKLRDGSFIAGTISFTEIMGEIMGVGFLIVKVPRTEKYTEFIRHICIKDVVSFEYDIVFRNIREAAEKLNVKPYKDAVITRCTTHYSGGGSAY